MSVSRRKSILSEKRQYNINKIIKVVLIDKQYPKNT